MTPIDEMIGFLSMPFLVEDRHLERVLHELQRLIDELRQFGAQGGGAEPHTVLEGVAAQFGAIADELEAGRKERRLGDDRLERIARSFHTIGQALEETAGRN